MWAYEEVFHYIAKYAVTVLNVVGAHSCPARDRRKLTPDSSEELP